MVLRVLTLVAFLGVHASVGALTGLLHLCQGEVQLRASCCCGHSRQLPPPEAVSLSLSGEVRCCDMPVVQPASTVALATEESRWQAPPRVLPPSPPVLAPVPAQESLPPAWAVTRAIRQATAPPLYVQYGVFLI